ncbi:MAG: hypothetical protein ABUL50_13535 [Rhizobacter sp.]
MLADLAHEHLSGQYQIHVRRDGLLDEVEVHCELQYSSGGNSPPEQIATQLGQRIKDLIGISAQVRVLPPDSIERSAGKARRVVDQRGK